MNYHHLLYHPMSPDYLALADLSLRSFDSPGKSWPPALNIPSTSRRPSMQSPSLDPWLSLLAPYPPAPRFPFFLPTGTNTQYLRSSPIPNGHLLLHIDRISVPAAPAHVVCNAPLVAPIPLPYHSPTFLQFDLPDIDADLSHPPYTRTRAATKRKRDEEEDGGRAEKRRAHSSTSGNAHWTPHPRAGPRNAARNSHYARSSVALPYQPRR
ncbi:hypothetical protein B0H10DRAFT_2217863 [Mycena sp. CBHHK59/15]|nr:hypothetical protein B0H10DRAFT_2217863 [Mycena sp. CBHHK59/15]